MSCAPTLAQLLALLAPAAAAHSVGEITALPPSPYPEEEEAIAQAVERRQREFRAGRHHARCALAQLGLPPLPLPRLPGRAPRWPHRTVGSISHADTMCTAIAAPEARIAAIGIDIEALKPIESALVKVLLTPAERAAFADAETGGGEGEAPLPVRTFAAKEALFKAYHPATGRSPDFLDVEIQWGPSPGEFSAVVGPSWPAAGGRRRFPGRWGVAEGHVLTLVWVEARPPVPLRSERK